MTFLLAFGPANPPQVTRSRGVGVVYKFVKPTTITEVELELVLCANIAGASDEL